VPALYQAKTQRHVGHLRDSFAVLSDAQQSGTTLSKLNGSFFSCRVSAEVINFLERRTLAAGVEA
jgi:hypothetical protein